MVGWFCKVSLVDLQRGIFLKILFKFAASEARNKLYSTDLEVQREEERYKSTSTQEHQNVEGKMKKRVN